MTRQDLITDMVQKLRCIDVDLGDERDVVRKLTAEPMAFRAGVIVACIDEVIEETRRQGLKRSWA